MKNAQAALQAALQTGYTETWNSGDHRVAPYVTKAFNPTNVLAHADQFLQWLDEKDSEEESRASLEQRVSRLEGHQGMQR
ncbi:hypothetical protein NY057_05160 [Curtobacterium flaccumfaciens]|uniref:hypothetical protein n=1 Tax=Curtobacterium flaccumfaciens TaxID=2035 RepID=UPI002202711B|nr:hypothetical protein [Curtobacterium flaccumfaciens]UWD83635.1 hypothetical protein NY057_05160 [Curtobacterium flaccumfaciens]